jgi:hypothetical protein
VVFWKFVSELRGNKRTRLFDRSPDRWISGVTCGEREPSLVSIVRVGVEVDCISLTTTTLRQHRRSIINHLAANDTRYHSVLEPEERQSDA